MSLKQLNDLMDRVTQVQEKHSASKSNRIADDSWSGRRDRIFTALKSVDELFDSFDDAKKNNAQDLPKIKNKIRGAHSLIRDILGRMKAEFEKKVKKSKRKKHPGPELLAEIEKMKEDLVTLHDTYEKSKADFETKLGITIGSGGAGASHGRGISAMQIELTNFMSGGSSGADEDSYKPSASASYDSEPLGAYEQQALEQVDEAKKEMNNKLDQLEELMPQIQEIASAIGEELDVQNTMIDQAVKRVNKANDKLDKVDASAKDFLVQQKANNHICYIIGCILLLGLLGVMYNLFKGSQ
jgi:chromosome segregation ATPase